MTVSIQPVRAVSRSALGQSCLAAGWGKIRRVHIVLAGNPNEGEEGIAARKVSAAPRRCGADVSVMAQTGHSEAIHSPDACASIVVRLIIPAAGSVDVVCTTAISCWPSVLRTISSPLDKGAFLKIG